MASWTHESSSGEDTLWLKDLLPHRIPNARVMTFSYMATIIGNASVGGIRDNARALLGLLTDEREDNEDRKRPIVFLGHSLGGIIIKQTSWTSLALYLTAGQALRIANNEANFSDIARCTKGILFFGTPHRGATAAKWLSLVTDIAATAYDKPRSAFVDVLEPNSQDLMDVSEDFRSIATRYALITFVEQDIFDNIGSVIVEKHSAVMELAHEEVMMLSGNHLSLCKFTAGDKRFDAVCRRIKRAARGPQCQGNFDQVGEFHGSFDGRDFRLSTR
ncbi:uncharacterized protein PAC_12699 [Phialocephala subalpina]|uniref:DUF676 domain-containing protein n=1 Tax=Phialocephala subalpina TaxID=576137 RepID=A0A1L7XCQ8_9HELO|nr:uncharacterized protein PAC_12699 [Phialocephala subalpina]